MKGDFARITFDPTLHYSHVFQQQGRVLLEADWNEQAAIQLHLLRTLASDLVGPCWAAGDGFTITTTDVSGTTLQLGNWQLSAGHFYVDGILCENNAACAFAKQPYAPTPDDGANGAGSSVQNPALPCALWLDVWERHLSWVEAPPILDAALNGVDTCSRAQVVWQLRMIDQQQADQLLNSIVNAMTQRLTALDPTSGEYAAINTALTALTPLNGGSTGATLSQIAAAFNKAVDQPHGVCIGLRQFLNARRDMVCPRLRAELQQPDSDPDPCIIAADARYRGCENQLYRVEIHQGTAPVIGGNLATVLDTTGAATASSTVATFKWSRENGSVIFLITAATPPGTPDTNGDATMTVTLASPGRDDRLGLAEGDWVELVDDNYTLAQCAYPLLQIANLDSTKCSVTLIVPKSSNPQPYQLDMTLHPLLRRWDQRLTESVKLTAEGVIEVTEGTAIDLEGGIQITFQSGGLYATGDYWVIPARVASGGTLDWPPGPDGKPVMLPAKAVHHYAVLGIVDANNPNKVSTFNECCCRVPSLCSLLANRNNTNQAATASDAATTSPPLKANVATSAIPAAAVIKAPAAAVASPAMTTIETPAATAGVTPAGGATETPAAADVAGPSKTKTTAKTRVKAPKKSTKSSKS